MKMKKILGILLSIMLVCSMALSFSACGEKDKDKEKDIVEIPNEELSEPELEEKAEKLNEDENNFYGTWEATSENAEHLYGNLTITIKEDGTFDANVTDEEFSGTWKKIDGGIEYESVYMNGKIFYGKKCKMVIEDSGLNVTMEKR